MELNKKNLRALMLLITFTLVLFWAFSNLEQLGSLISWLLALLTPFLLGFCIAFVLNIILRPMETLWNRLLRKVGKPWKKRLRRPVCLVLSTAIFLGLVSTVFLVLVPQIRSTVASISSMIPQSVDKAEQWWHELSVFLNRFGAYLPELQLNSDEIIKTLTDFFTDQGSAMVNKTLDITLSIFKLVFNIILAFIISLYVLGRKEDHGRSFRRALRAVLKPERADRALEIISLVNRSFTNYVTGQVTEAVILGLLCMTGMLIFGFPYAPVISVVISFTALIPIFGAWMGAVVGAFLIVFVDPMKALWFLIFLIILQQVEGNLIYPKVVGKSVGLPGIWVLAAVTLGGGAFGILGMLLGVPICAVIYTLGNEFILRRTKHMDKA